MSFIKLGAEFGATQEATLVPNGAYDLRATGFLYEEDKHRIRVNLEVENPPEGLDDVAPIFHYIFLPAPEDDADKSKSKMLFAKRFLYLFGVPYTDEGFDPEDIPGTSARKVTCEQEEYDGRHNVRIKLPQLPEDLQASSGKRRPRRA